MTDSPRIRRILLAIATLALVCVAIAALPHDAAAAPEIAWSKCYGPFECATVRVPLDYDRPRGETIAIALTRLPATDPGRRIGSLFLNPGGPGGSGVEFVVGIGKELYTPEVRARFDLVGFDPRGIMRSSGLRCFGAYHVQGRLRSAKGSLGPLAIISTSDREAFEAQVNRTAKRLERAGNR